MTWIDAESAVDWPALPGQGRLLLAEREPNAADTVVFCRVDDESAPATADVQQFFARP